ncbi:hypothetical protein BDZ90DRAFT_231069 [Jaminaea rosea]|uniref:Amino acid permease/ SLC12A domain-containing protein n=1 Tax=Jaminaea rosea TaxID=1569628 RepID=A0A316UUT2_9BASI|nr:hypothetical protein BDZ90DRAFT_231069 [Jaminaea rosea]PWN29070.1 hypothetical protein BDZ90DRAFT_231069 [Jaminaea rosea]
MSHFVSSKGNEGFEALAQQLLRREPVDEGKDEAEEALSYDTTSQRASVYSNASAAGPSSPPSAALKRPTTPAHLEGGAAGVAASSSSSTRGSPSIRSPSYSRKNSPERSDRPKSPHPLRKSIHEAVSSNFAGQGATAATARYPDSDDVRSRPQSMVGVENGGSRAGKSGRNVSFSQEQPSEDGALSYQQHEPVFDELLGPDAPLLERTGRRNTGMLAQSDAPRKLGTWDGVFVPVTLNILSIMMFLRFGFVLGQAGLIGSIALLIVCFAIDALTSMSISAISTNGVVRAGGIFYLASRSLGPEFGGATGLLFWLGQSLNASLNALGFVETLTDAFGESREEGGVIGIPEGPWWSLFYGSFVLLLSTVVCLVGSRLFVKATMVLAVILGISILSIPVSSVLLSPYSDEERGIFYTGWSLETLQSNLWPHFTRGAAGSSSANMTESWASVFGVLFPAVTGILAGASMSGDLRKPSKSIPKGTHWSLLCTFTIYFVVLVVLAGTTARTSFYLDIGVMGDISVMPIVITLGALATTSFSALMGIQACGKVLQAIARDHLLPVLDIFAQGTEQSDTPTFGIVATYLICQVTLVVDSVNVIAQLVTLITLLCFAVLSFACLALKAGGAPSFRPSFPYFNIYTAAAGAAASLVAMFFTNGMAASGCILLSVLLFIAIHIFSPPKPWGDVTRNIDYWLTRKHLLRLDERKTNLKHWRPQILFLANNPRSEWNLLMFCNSLKKGGLYVLGHCIKGEFSECLLELRKQQIAWLKLVDLSGIKAFVDVVIAPDERQGARSLILSAGLGGMRPNIVVLGFPRDLRAHISHNMSKGGGGSAGSDVTIRGPHAVSEGKTGASIEHLPTDATRRESPIMGDSYVGIIEDALALNKAVAVAYGFDMMRLPGPSEKHRYERSTEKQYIDLWPIQIASSDSQTEHAWDTYTMVLQLGTILSLTGTWKSHKLRVSVFVEEASEVDEERRRVRSLLDNLRIPASLRVFCLSDKTVSSYEAIVLGVVAPPPHVEEALRSDPWWNSLKKLRKEERARAQQAAAAKRASEKATDIPGQPSAGTSGAPRSKREQKLLGYSLPPEHLEFFQRNIRIGLSHPRAKPRVDDSDVEDDDDSGSDGDSDGSGLSDELLRLGEDGLFGGPAGHLTRSNSASTHAISRPRGFRSGRGRSYSHGVGGLPDEPTLRQQRRYGNSSENGGTTTPGPGSYGSMASTPVVRPDGTVANPGGLRFGKSGGRSSARRGLEEGDDGQGDSTLKASDRSKMQRHLSSRSSPPPSRSASRASSRSSQTRSPLSSSIVAEDPFDSASSSKSGTTSLSNSTTLPSLSFNTLPNKAQFLILNQLFRAHSSSSATSVILTSLPAPEPGTAKDPEAVQRYLAQLEVLCAGSTPVLGIHARELTLSTSL